MLLLCAAGPLLAQSSGRDYGAEGYMHCCEKRLRVHVPDADWAFDDREVDCRDYLEKNPKSRQQICRDLESHSKSINCREISGICCPYWDVCGPLGQAIGIARRTLLTAAAKPGSPENFNVARAKEQTKGLLEALRKALGPLQDKKCNDAKTAEAIDKMLTMIGWIKPNPVNSADVNNNAMVLKGIESTLWRLAAGRCGTELPNEPCHVPPIPPLDGLAKHDCETNCRDCMARKGPDGKPLVGSDIAAAAKCLAKAGANIASTYRSEEYQQHFWDLYQGYVALLRTMNPNCYERMIEYAQHMRHHQIVSSVSNPGGGNAGQHPRGAAVDAGGVSPTAAACCNLYKPYPKGDPIHYEICKPPCVPQEGCK